MDTIEKLIQWLRYGDPSESLFSFRIETIQRIAGRILDGTIDHFELSDTLYELALILLDDDGERLVVEFCPCGHTSHWTLTKIIAAGGFRQLVDIYQSRRFSAPTFHSTTSCQECADDFAYRMEKLDYMMSL